jgi:hypothetical protein
MAMVSWSDLHLTPEDAEKLENAIADFVETAKDLNALIHDELFRNDVREVAVLSSLLSNRLRAPGRVATMTPYPAH